MNNILHKVKTTLLKTPTYVLKIPYNVENYNEVIEIWKEYLPSNTHDKQNKNREILFKTSVSFFFQKLMI